MRCRLLYNVFHALIILDCDKSPTAIPAFPQITFFFCIANSTDDIEFYLKTGFVAAMWTKLGRHYFLPFYRRENARGTA